MARCECGRVLSKVLSNGEEILSSVLVVIRGVVDLSGDRNYRCPSVRNRTLLYGATHRDTNRLYIVRGEVVFRGGNGRPFYLVLTTRAGLYRSLTFPLYSCRISVRSLSSPSLFTKLLPPPLLILDQHRGQEGTLYVV